MSRTYGSEQRKNVTPKANCSCLYVHVGEYECHEFEAKLEDKVITISCISIKINSYSVYRHYVY